MEDLQRAKKQKSDRISQKVEISKAKLKSRARERHVPASRIERVGHFGAGALSLGKLMTFSQVLTFFKSESYFLGENTHIQTCFKV